MRQLGKVAWVIAVRQQGTDGMADPDDPVRGGGHHARQQPRPPGLSTSRNGRWPSSAPMNAVQSATRRRSPSAALSPDNHALAALNDYAPWLLAPYRRARLTPNLRATLWLQNCRCPAYSNRA